MQSTDNQPTKFPHIKSIFGKECIMLQQIVHKLAKQNKALKHNNVRKTQLFCSKRQHVTNFIWCFVSHLFVAS